MQCKALGAGRLSAGAAGPSCAACHCAALEQSSLTLVKTDCRKCRARTRGKSVPGRNSSLCLWTLTPGLPQAGTVIQACVLLVRQCLTHLQDVAPPTTEQRALSNLTFWSPPDPRTQDRPRDLSRPTSCYSMLPHFCLRNSLCSGLLTYWTGVISPCSQRSEDKTYGIESDQQEVH